MGEFAEFAELATQVMARCETLGTLSQDPACLEALFDRTTQACKSTRLRVDD